MLATIGGMAQRGPYSKTAETRARILDAALRIISDNGYSGATVQEIADAVGMSKPGVLHHFGSRDALLTAIVERRDEIDVAIAGSDPFTVDSLVATVRHNATVPGLVALYTALTGVATTDGSATASHDFFTDRYRRVVDLMTESVRAAQQQGVVPDDRDPVVVARLLIAAADGLQVQWLLDPTVDMAAHLEQLWSLVLA